jgi:hypothetical protein
MVDYLIRRKKDFRNEDECENESEIVVFGVFTRRDFFVLFLFQFLRQLDDFCIHT